jgi:DNA-binding HxlR family transcriptional regulator
MSKMTLGLPPADTHGLVVTDNTIQAARIEVPPRVEYEISELGRSLAPLFAPLAEWSINLDKVEQARLDYDARQRIRLR